MEEHPTPKSLSHDEKKAAEAAFAGRPFNPTWSAHARLVYDGIVKALPAPSGRTAPSEDATPTRVEETTAEESRAAAPESAELLKFGDMKQAIESGTLIDVTPTARQLGISFPMAVTKPLWELGIAGSQTLTEEEQSRRLRDVLMAFRLRLSSLVTVSPLIDFPALLALPPNTVPQPIPLFALIQPDEEHRATVTLLLPNEVAATIIPMN